MKRQIKSAVIVAAALASVVGNGLPASACGGRGGGFGGGFGGSIGRGYSRPAMNYSRPAVTYQPTHATNVYAQPVYSQSVYSTPVQQHTVYQQPNYTQPTQTFTQPNVVQSQRVVAQQPAAPTTSVAQTTSVKRQQTTAPIAQTKPAAQTQPVAKQQTAQQSALQALVSRNTTTATSAAQPAEEATPSIPEFTAASSTTAIASHVGTWKVTLPGNQSVELSLDADSKFIWTATKDGKTSEFDGQYRLDDGRLTLVRSTDLQQMTGDWTAKDTGFTFKLDGAKTGGLNFNRS
ncbi:MAG: hypothetical protein WBD20_22785 [Pirellulaceae bacterium]